MVSGVNGANLTARTLNCIEDNMSNEEIKNILASRTIWAALVGFAAFLAQTVWNFDIGDQETIINTILNVVQGVGFLLAIVFRALASKKLAL